jgi:hypothetical protein
LSKLSWIRPDSFSKKARRKKENKIKISHTIVKKKLKNYVKKLSKNYQKIVKKVSKNWSSSCQKVVKKLSKNCQKVDKKLLNQKFDKNEKGMKKGMRQVGAPTVPSAVI